MLQRRCYSNHVRFPEHVLNITAPLHTAPLVHRPTSRSLAHSGGIARCPISTVYHKEVVLESFLSVNILQHYMHHTDLCYHTTLIYNHAYYMYCNLRSLMYSKTKHKSTYKKLTNTCAIYGTTWNI